jgi:hypothetical protein
MATDTATPSDIAEVYGTIITLLNEAASAETTADLRHRYNSNSSHEQRVKEYKAAKDVATKAWLAAKHLYCTRKEDLDKYHNEVQDTVLASNWKMFEDARRVVEEEMTKQLEKQLLDSDPKDDRGDA